MAFVPVVESLLDTDLYKFTMLQAFLHRFPAATGEYRFHCRNHPAPDLARWRGEIEAQLDHLCTLRFRDEELEYLRGLRFIKPDLADYLDLFQFRRRFIKVREAPDAAGGLEIVARGPLMHVMLFEIFVLAIVSEVHFRASATPRSLEAGRER